MSETAKLPLPDKIETRERRKKQPDPVELKEHALLSDSESAEKVMDPESLSSAEGESAMLSASTDY